jgi:hypothetical protein
MRASIYIAYVMCISGCEPGCTRCSNTRHVAVPITEFYPIEGLQDGLAKRARVEADLLTEATKHHK